MGMGMGMKIDGVVGRGAVMMMGVGREWLF
jgi:hypothetical protein